MTPHGDRIVLAHGGGGSLTRELIRDALVRRLDNPLLHPLDDSAVFPLSADRYAFTTDSYVVKPYFFPGGDIGRLAVCGTVNDLAVQGAQPLYLSLSLILEEGLSLADLEQVVDSIRSTADEAEIHIVTGDTKVVEHGRCEGLYITTAGIGRVVASGPLGGAYVQAGDAVLINGALAEHGIAVLSRRPGVSFSTGVTSDCAPLWGLVRQIIEAGVEIHAMRDPTRGGLAATVADIAQASEVGVWLDEKTLPISREVRGACDLLGLDPLSIANEGKVVVFCRGEDAESALAAMRTHPLGRGAHLIGQVREDPPGMALLRTAIGGERIIDLPTGEDLPRIC